MSALRNYAFLVLFPVHPLPVAQYRDALTPSRAKDDPTAAALPGELLLKHRDTLTPLPPQSPAMRALTPRVAPRRRLGGDNVRWTNRLPRALKHYCPHVWQWCPEKDTGRFCDFLSRWPPLKAVQLARRATLEGFFRAHPVRSAEVLPTRIAAIKSAMALTPDAGGILPQVFLGPALVAPLRVTLPAIADFATARAQQAHCHRDCPWFDALPGAGAVFAPRLLGAWGEQRERSASAEELQNYAGIAPVTERRGKQAWVHWRLQWPTFLRHTCVAWAAESTRQSFWAQAYSPQQRDTGNAHQAAVRALAFKGSRMLFRGWQERTP